MDFKKIHRLVLCAMLLAIGLLLPLLTAQIKEIGDSLLPMHLPVLLCGLICGPWYGMGLGLCLPFLRSLLFSMPPLYPNAVWMALELGTYGLVTGLLYACGKQRSRRYLFFSLVMAMLAGRIVWGVTKAALLGVGEKGFTWAAFFVGGFADALPGIILQFLLIPLIMEAVERYRNSHTQD